MPQGFWFMCILTRGLFPRRSSCESGQIVALKCSGECLSPLLCPQELPLDLAVSSLPLYPLPSPASIRVWHPELRLTRAPRLSCRVRAAPRCCAGGRGGGRAPGTLALAGQRVPWLPAPLRRLCAGTRMDRHGSSLCAQVPPGSPVPSLRGAVYLLLSQALALVALQ